MRGLTVTQVDGLKRLRDNIGWSRGKSRMGGSIARMFDRLVQEGLCDGPPYKITDEGRKELTERGL